jgi:hypothetical protein
VKKVIDTLSGIRGVEDVVSVQERKRRESGGFCLLEFLRGEEMGEFWINSFLI